MSRAPSQVAAVVLKGGLNLASSVLEMGPGECVQLFNYEVNTLGRYQRIMGYERIDGQPAPSEVVPSALVGYPFADDETEEAAINAEKTARRAAILALPGAGPVRGVVAYKGILYGFRDSTDGTECCMYKATATGWQKVTTPARFPGGDYYFEIGNFKGSAKTIKLYGVDGVNKAFEFDGSVFKEIDGPITPDRPTRIEITPTQTLLLAYRGGSFVFSGVGEPRKFSPADGGGEVAVSDEITGMEVQANNATAIFCRHKTYMLYGTSSADFQLETLSKTTGAIPGSIQTIADSIYIDDRGMARLNRVQQFGNFDAATVSQKIEPLLKRYINRVSASFTVKEKNQYRLCFDDGTGIITTMYGDEVSGFTTFDYGKTITCAWSGEDLQGREVIYFGADDGFVYQAEKGFTFDGNPVPYVCRPAFTNLGSPEHKKRWRKVVVEADTVGAVELYVSPDYDYSDPNIPFESSRTVIAMGGGGYWDEATWDETRWSSSSTFTADVYIDGVSRNISVVVSGEDEDQPPHILNSHLIHFSPRSRRR